MKKKYDNGFTLIELSIVLVIIGLVIGGVLVGRDLIASATIRAQVSQLEKYRTAMYTFSSKYNGIPGDISEPNATAFGFVTRGTSPGQGDGNGIIQGVDSFGFTLSGYSSGNGELAMFWRDLSDANLIDGSFSTATPTSTADIAQADIPKYFPAAALGGQNHIYLWSTLGKNYFGIFRVTSFNSGLLSGTLNIPVITSYSIDVKVDDGMPHSGKVITARFAYPNPTDFRWAGGTVGAPSTAATPGSNTTCTDNSATPNGTPGVAGVAQHYSLEMNDGRNPACAMSFAF